MNFFLTLSLVIYFILSPASPYDFSFDLNMVDGLFDSLERSTHLLPTASKVKLTQP